MLTFTQQVNGRVKMKFQVVIRVLGHPLPYFKTIDRLMVNFLLLPQIREAVE